nr:U32 family peptidase [Methanobrevibacter arboriphilus]
MKKNNKDLELEVFSHGALCYSISGKCYISSLNNGRSGNRGACTQPCRREYILKYKGHRVSDGYLLSTHDLNLSDDLDNLAKSGINSIKLEGRMKSEDYVGTIVNSYRNLLDKKEGSFKDDLNFVFNRRFTKGYIMNQSPSEVMGRESSGHLGLYIGDIVAINREYPEIIEKEEISNKNSRNNRNMKNSRKNRNNKNNNNTNSHNNSTNIDNSINSINSNNSNNSNNAKFNSNSKDINNNSNNNIQERKSRTVKEIKVSKENPINIEKGDGIAFKYGKKVKGIYIDDIIDQNDEYIVFNTTRNIRVGDEVYISYSRSINKELKKYKKEFIQSKIPISLNISLDKELHAKIETKFNLNNETIKFKYSSSSKFEKAINHPITKEEIEKQLSKTGNTPFFMNNITINDFPDNLFIPTSKLNKIRREILDKASEKLLNYYKKDKNQIKDAKSRLNRFIKNYKSKSIKNNENNNLKIKIIQNLIIN